MEVREGEGARPLAHRPLRRDVRSLEADEWIDEGADGGEGLGKVRTGKAARAAKGLMVPAVLGDDEWIDDHGFVRTSFTMKDICDRASGGRPVKFLLKDDEYIEDKDCYLRVRAPHLTYVSTSARRVLDEDEYIDEFGLVRQDLEVRQMLESQNAGLEFVVEDQAKVVAPKVGKRCFYSCTMFIWRDSWRRLVLVVISNHHV